MRISKIIILFSSFALIGAGCFGGGTKSTGADGGVFKTLDAGATWSQKAAIVSSSGVGSIASTNILNLEIDPQDSRTLYAGSFEHGMFYTIDGATTWQQPREAGLKEGTISAIEVDPKDVCTVYVAKGQRLFKSFDCLRSFTSEAYIETRTNVSVRRIAVDWYNPLIVWMGLSNGDVLKSEDGGVRWQSSLAGKSAVTGILVNNADSRVVLVATEGGGFYKTIDSGVTWTHVSDELKDFKKGASVSTIVQNKDGSVLIAATGYGLLRSKDFGSTWEGITLLSAPGQVEIFSIAMDTANTATIMYASGTTFYRSIDSGVTWTTAKISSARTPMAMLLDPSDANSIYLGVMSTEK